MIEVLRYFRANGYRTYIVTGGGQDFVRVYAEATYGIPPEQVVGTAGGTQYGYDKNGRPFLTKEPKLLLNDNNAGKPEGIHLMIGRRPHARSATPPATADAGVHQGRRGCTTVDARPARRRHARVCLWSSPGAAGHQGRHVHASAVRRGDERWLDRHQHEARLAAHLCFRIARRFTIDEAMKQLKEDLARHPNDRDSVSALIAFDREDAKPR